jgi:hypothetical protein
MVKSKKYFVMLILIGVCLVSSQTTNAALELDLWMTGELVGTELTVEVHRTNTEFGLGGLSYNLQFSESLETSREYSDYGWIANNIVFDGSSPEDGDSPVSLTNAVFDTVVNPAGTEFPADTSGVVEMLTFTNISMLSERWIYIDLQAPDASDGSGQSLIGDLGGSINVIDQSGLPEAHTFGIYVVPEPTTFVLFGLGSLALLKRRKS